METFEFVLEGPPVSIRAKKTATRRYQRWVRAVKAAARKLWPDVKQPIVRPVTVVITNYYTLAPPDVDNIIKPILDALNGVAYVDDEQVHRVCSEKVDLTSSPLIEDPSVLLADAIGRYSEVVHVVVSWEAEE